MVDLHDDKSVTNQLLNENGLPIPQSILISHDNAVGYQIDFSFPVVIKPIRGRGSEGVRLVQEPKKLSEIVHAMFKAGTYGVAIYVEQYLPGEEITITVMPPRVYTFPDQSKIFSNFWCLHAVKRINHHNGMVPYNGTTAVINNSVVLNTSEIQIPEIQKLCRQCEQAAKLVHMKAPIRIGCRADKKGNYFLFDLNMKPNMTGSGRPGRNNQEVYRSWHPGR